MYVFPAANCRTQFTKSREKNSPVSIYQHVQNYFSLKVLSSPSLLVELHTMAIGIGELKIQLSPFMIASLPTNY